MKVFKTGLFVTEFMNQNERLQNSVKIRFNSRGTNGVLSAIFPFWAKIKIVITTSRDDLCENFLIQN